MTISYRISHIHVDEFSFAKEEYLAGKGFRMFQNFAFSFDDSTSSLNVTFAEEMEQGSKRFLSAKLSVSFELDTYSVKALTHGNTLTIPADFLIQCASITYGTMRGVVIARTEEQGAADIIMPPKRINEVIKRPMNIDLTK